MFHNDTTITVGKEDHQSRSYTFSHFTPDISPTALLTYPDGVKGYRLFHPTTHELFIERSVHFQESPLESTFDTSPKSLDLLGSNHDSNSSDETPEKILNDEESSSRIYSKSYDRDPYPSTPSHSLEDEDSPPDSPTASPL
eukprot:Gb_19534 [translate_table: standard]